LSSGVVNIVGVGSTLMGDDGVGPAVVDALARRGGSDGVALHDAGLAVSDVLGRLDPADPLIVVDALRAGGQPGDVYRADLDELALAEGSSAACLSLHELNVLPALRMEALSGRAFRNVTVFGVEPASIEWGEGLSAPVAAAVERVSNAILQHVDAQRTIAVAGELSI